MKRQAMEWENIFVIPISEQKTYIQNTCGTPSREKELITQLKEKSKRFKRHFTQQQIHMNRWSTLLAIWQMLIKAQWDTTIDPPEFYYLKDR